MSLWVKHELHESLCMQHVKTLSHYSSSQRPMSLAGAWSFMAKNLLKRGAVKPKGDACMFGVHAMLCPGLQVFYVIWMNACGFLRHGMSNTHVALWGFRWQIYRLVGHACLWFHSCIWHWHKLTASLGKVNYTFLHGMHVCNDFCYRIQPRCTQSKIAFWYLSHGFVPWTAGWVHTEAY